MESGYRAPNNPQSVQKSFFQSELIIPHSHAKNSSISSFSTPTIPLHESPRTPHHTKANIGRHRLKPPVHEQLTPTPSHSAEVSKVFSDAHTTIQKNVDSVRTHASRIPLPSSPFLQKRHRITNDDLVWSPERGTGDGVIIAKPPNSGLSSLSIREKEKIQGLYPQIDIGKCFNSPASSLYMPKGNFQSGSTDTSISHEDDGGVKLSNNLLSSEEEVKVQNWLKTIYYVSPTQTAVAQIPHGVPKQKNLIDRICPPLEKEIRPGYRLELQEDHSYKSETEAQSWSPGESNNKENHPPLESNSSLINPPRFSKLLLAPPRTPSKICALLPGPTGYLSQPPVRKKRRPSYPKYNHTSNTTPFKIFEDPDSHVHGIGTDIDLSPNVTPYRKGREPPKIRQPSYWDDNILPEMLPKLKGRAVFAEFNEENPIKEGTVKAIVDAVEEKISPG
ncbi:MAG: hypothetical protein M1834_005324 [Cirrosporium novae-zelandiae]|nr:MAG: hypothetical protein M1834_005324 [Cirrosporium novae-zelandiae]